MTARTSHQPPGRYRFRQLARMEWIKLRSLRSTWLTLAIAVPVSGHRPRNRQQQHDKRRHVRRQHAGRHADRRAAHRGSRRTGHDQRVHLRAIRATFAAAPRRLKVLAAKAAVVGAVALITGEAAAFLSFLAGCMTLRHGITAPALSSPVSCGRSHSPEPASA